MYKQKMLRNRINAARESKLVGAEGKVLVPEQMSRLRVENARLKRGMDILKAEVPLRGTRWEVLLDAYL